jgi:hypothetical protein
MRTKEDIIQLASYKIFSAEILLKHDVPNEAFYIGGYALELYLKLMICKTLDISDLFDFDNHSSKYLSSKSDRKASLFKQFKVHDYEQLILLSGLFTQFKNQLSNNQEFNSDWSIVSKWNENSRYIVTQSMEDTEIFIQSIKNIIKWLQQFL